MQMIIDKQFGQLGNTLYRLANVIAFARDQGASVWDCSMVRGGYDRFFPHVRNRLLLRFPSPPAPSSFLLTTLHKLQRKLIRKVIDLRSPPVLDAGEYCDLQAQLGRQQHKRVVLRGLHFVADESVQFHEAYLRELFSPENAVINAAAEQRKGACSTSEVLVAVHIRRGDFQTWSGGRYFFDLSYYARAMHAMRSFFSQGQARFMLFSDDPALETSAFQGLDVARPTSGLSDIAELTLMSMCNYIIAPLYSTFSGWASFYGRSPIYRLYGPNQPGSLSDFNFVPILNNTTRFVESNLAREVVRD